MCGLPIARRRARLLQEALVHLVVARHVAAQHLDGDLLVDDLVAGRVDDAHPAFAEDPLDDVAAVDRLADVRIDLGRRRRARVPELRKGRTRESDRHGLRRRVGHARGSVGLRGVAHVSSAANGSDNEKLVRAECMDGSNGRPRMTFAGGFLGDLAAQRKTDPRSYMGFDGPCARFHGRAAFPLTVHEEASRWSFAVDLYSRVGKAARPPVEGSARGRDP